MRYFGFNFGHDTGVTILNSEGKVIFYAESERFAPRLKHYSSNLDPITDVFPYISSPGKNDIVGVSWPYQKPITPISGIEPAIYQRGNQWKKSHGVREELIISHHFCHIVSSWCFRPNNDERLFIGYDGAGSNGRGDIRSSQTGYISPDGFGVYNEAYEILTSVPVLNLLGSNSPGKVMGLVGYLDDIPEWKWDDEIFKTLVFMSFFPDPHFPTMSNPLTNEKMQFVASFYNYVTGLIWNGLEHNIRNYANQRGIVIGGGTALALELNTKIHELVGDVVFGPPVNDSGLSLGAAAVAYFHVNKRWPPAIHSPSLQALQKPLPAVGPQDPGEIAEQIVKGKVIGLLRGNAEAGPRALGFRSILAAAEKPENLRLVSEVIKGREFYRPLAPVVTAEAFDKYFDGPKGEYMQYRCLCKEKTKEELPAVVHRDGSARPQVVYRESDPWLHDLLVTYGSITGHECLINTSLNGKGTPICNTYEDAVADLRGKPVELVSIKTPATKSTLESFL